MLEIHAQHLGVSNPEKCHTFITQVSPQTHQVKSVKPMYHLWKRMIFRRNQWLVRRSMSWNSKPSSISNVHFQTALTWRTGSESKHPVIDFLFIKAEDGILSSTDGGMWRSWMKNENETSTQVRISKFLKLPYEGKIWDIQHTTWGSNQVGFVGWWVQSYVCAK